MKNVKRVLSVFFLLVFIFSCFSEDVLAVDTIPNAVLNSTKSVVRIKADYGIVTSSGSGFVIESSNSRTLVVTNDHVIEDSPASISVYVGQEDAVSAHVLSTSSQKDICVLELSYPVNIPPVKLSSSEAKQGDIVYAVGFPGASDTLSDKTAQTSDEATITSGIVSAVRGLTTSAYGSSVSIIQINADLNSGNSGGPLFNSEGHVVGINTYGISSAQGVNGAINVSELEAFLLENNISVLSSSSGGSSAVWFVISASLLVICAVAAFLLIRRKCCKRAEGGEKKMKIRKRTHPRVILSEYMLQSPRGLGINLAVSALMPVLLQIRDMHNNGNLHLQLSPFTLTVSEEGFFANPPSENAGAKYTPGFAAPEIYTEKGISTATDTYSLAALLYYCVCGKTPVNAINRAPGENIDIPETIQDSNFAEILNKGLSYEPSERFSSVQELVHALSPYNISPVLSQQDVLPAVPATEIHSAGETNAEPLPEQSPETAGSIMRKPVKKILLLSCQQFWGALCCSQAYIGAPIFLHASMSKTKSFPKQTSCFSPHQSLSCTTKNSSLILMRELLLKTGSSVQQWMHLRLFPIIPMLYICSMSQHIGALHSWQIPMILSHPLNIIPLCARSIIKTQMSYIMIPYTARAFISFLRLENILRDMKRSALFQKIIPEFKTS